METFKAKYLRPGEVIIKGVPAAFWQIRTIMHVPPTKTIPNPRVVLVCDEVTHKFVFDLDELPDGKEPRTGCAVTYHPNDDAAVEMVSFVNFLKQVFGRLK